MTVIVFRALPVRSGLGRQSPRAAIVGWPEGPSRELVVRVPRFRDMLWRSGGQPGDWATNLVGSGMWRFLCLPGGRRSVLA